MSTEQALAATIRERSDVFERHFEAGDAQALVADYYVSDADGPLLSMPDAALIKGVAGIEAAFAGILGAFASCKLDNAVIHPGEGFAHELGRAAITTKDGTAMAARYSILWRETAAGWRVQSDFFAFGEL